MLRFCQEYNFKIIRDINLQPFLNKNLFGELPSALPILLFFLSEGTHLAYQIKGMEHRSLRKNVFCPYTHPRPKGLGQNIFF